MDELDQLNGPSKRVQSTIGFPYSDINDATAVAEGVLRGGGLAMSRDQLAASMGLAPGGGGFATKVATARSFGVIDTVAGKYVLTELGHEIVDPGRKAEAMAQAFLNPDLYRKLYDEFRGKRLPPRPAGLEAAFVNFGVSPKAAKQARQAFDRSARAAGFFPNGDEDRLVEPLIVPAKFISDNVQSVADRSLDEDSSIRVAPAAEPAPPIAGSIHKSILGMLDELPAPKTKWSKADQADWLEAMATLFQVIYKSDDDGSVSVLYTSLGTGVEKRPGNI